MNAQQERDRARSLRLNKLKPTITIGLPRLPRRYPIWSVKSITIVSLLLVAIVSFVIFFFGKRSVLVEAEWVTATVAVSLFLFLWIGLYRGIRVKKHEPAPSNFEFIDVDVGDVGNVGDIGNVFGAVDDLPGLFLAPILFVLFGVLLVFLLPVIINLVWLLMFIFVVMLFWVFRFALRQVFARSRQTRGNLTQSLRIASIYTALYSGWLLAVLIGARFIVERAA